jgi:hypothetical protein
MMINTNFSKCMDERKSKEADQKKKNGYQIYNYIRITSYVLTSKIKSLPHG